MKCQTWFKFRWCSQPGQYLVLASMVHGLALSAMMVEAGDWPQWRGPNRDGHVHRLEKPPTSLPKEATFVWRLKAGGGFSSVIVAGETLVYLDDTDKMETVHAVEAKTGKELWRHAIAKTFEDEWGIGPRSTPFAANGMLFVQSCNGEFQCLTLADGKLRWHTNFEADFGIRFLGSKANQGTASRRGNNGSGIAHEGSVVVPVGAPNGASLVCFQIDTGKLLWKSQDDEAAYSSLVAATLAGMEQVIAFTAEGLVGLDWKTGHLLWRVALKTNANRHAATPLIIGDDVVVNSHTIGLVCTRIVKQDGRLKASQAWVNPDLKINLATPVAVGSYLYTQGADKNYVCVDSTNGKLMWSQPGFGTGTKDYSSTIVLGKSLLILSEDGQLVLILADPKKYIELGRLQLCANTWSHAAFAQGKLYGRDRRELFCLDLSDSR